MRHLLTLTEVLGLEDVVAGVLLLAATLRITTHAGLASRRARWALFRRVLYVTTAGALFSIGVDRLEGADVVTAARFAQQTVVLFAVMAFPILRALRGISEADLDAFQGVRDSGVPGDLR